MSYSSKYLSRIVFLLLTLGLASEVYAFTPSPCISREVGCVRLTESLSMSNDDTTTNVEVTQAPPQPVVKCPDCDLCDGSGR